MAINVNGKTFDSKEEFARYGRGCATDIPTPIDILRVDEVIKANRSRRIMFDSLTITVKFIHLTYGAKGHISEEQRKKQIGVLNAAYAGAGINFVYKENDVEFVDNKHWYYMEHRSAAEREAKTALAHDPSKCLNFYTGGLEPAVLGWATFPYSFAGDPIMDGVVVLDESLPNGKAAPYNLGMTAVHEVGHWLGLYHTFQGGCNGVGDYVHDTPAHADANSGTPEDGLRHNACKLDELAPIHNYMNYVDDAWMNEFTEAQQVRMKEQILMYRTGLIYNEVRSAQPVSRS